VLFFGECFTIISAKPYKTRRIMMENLVKCVVGILAIFFAKSQMLKWINYVNQGGGGDMEWRVENG
jgi:hypothetical protein